LRWLRRGITLPVVSSSIQAQTGIPVKIVDRNGNEITDSTDSAGRAVPRFTTDPITRNSTFAYTDSQGSARNIAVSYVSVPVHTQLCPFSTEFGCTNEYQSNWKQPQTIQLPNGLAYQFSYEQNQYGEPNSVTLPTGATVTWTWGGLDQGGRKVTSRTVTSNGQSATWSYSWGTASFAGPWQNSMVDPAGNETVYTCQNKDGKPTAASLKKLLDSIAKHEKDYKGTISDAYYNMSAKATGQVDAYAQHREAQNKNPKRTPYNTGITGKANNCGTFCRDAVAAGGVNTSKANDDYRPAPMVSDMQRNADIKITYDAAGHVLTEIDKHKKTMRYSLRDL